MALFTGAIGEATVDVTKKTLVVHDGSTAGGHPLARQADACNPVNNLSELTNVVSARTKLDVYSVDESHAVVKGRAPAGGVFFSQTSQRIYAALSTYSIGTRQFSARVLYRAPTTVPSGTRQLLVIGPSNSAISNNSFVLLVTASGALEVRVTGSTANDYIYKQFAAFVSTYGGKLAEILVVRTFTGIAVYVNGMAQTLTTDATAGSSPGWLGSITSSNVFVGGSGAAALVGEIYGLTLFNYGLNAAQASSLNKEGIPASDLWATDSELITATADRDFSSASNWANSTMTGYNETGDLSLTADVADRMAYLPPAALTVALTAGQRYQVSCDVANLSGTTFRLSTDTQGDLGMVVSSNGNFVGNFQLLASSFGNLEIKSNGGGSVDLDNFSFRTAGAVLDWDFLESTPYFVADRSVNKFHGTMANVPTLLTEQWQGRVRGRTNTNGNQRLGNTLILRSNARISAIIINSDNSGTPTTSVNIGNASGGSQIAASVTVASGRREVATFASRFTTTGEIWINANGTSNLDITILFELVD